MIIYGVALLAICTLAGVIMGDMNCGLFTASGDPVAVGHAQFHHGVHRRLGAGLQLFDIGVVRLGPVLADELLGCGAVVAKVELNEHKACPGKFLGHQIEMPPVFKPLKAVRKHHYGLGPARFLVRCVN